MIETQLEAAAAEADPEKTLSYTLDKTAIMQLIRRDRAAATEQLAKTFMEKEHIYAIRNDENVELWIYKEGIYVPEGASYIQEHCRRSLGEAYTTTIGNLAQAKITTDHYINPDDFFSKDSAQKNLIPVNNGILNLQTKIIEPFSPDKIFFNKLPAQYIPGTDCPNIKAFTTQIFKNGAAEQQLISELFGWLLTNKYYPHKIVVIDGDGRNGKGTFFNLIKAFLGINNCSGIRFESFDKDDFATADLFGKRVNLFSDSGSVHFKDTSLLKSLSGEDMISAARKFKNRLAFTNNAKLFFAFNELPRISDLSFGYWNRQLYLSCPYRFITPDEIAKMPEQDKSELKVADPEIITKITSPEELSGLLNWAIEGYERLNKNGGFSYSLTTAEVQSIITRKSNSFAAFFVECLEEVEDAELGKDELRRQYINYCKKNGVKVCSDVYVKRQLADVGVDTRQLKDEKGRRVWVGIKLKDAGLDVNGEKGLLIYGNKSNIDFEVIGKSEISYNHKIGVTPVTPVTFGKTTQPVAENILQMRSIIGFETLTMQHGFAEGYLTKCILCGIERCWYMHKVTFHYYCPLCAEAVEKNEIVAK